MRAISQLVQPCPEGCSTIPGGHLLPEPLERVRHTSENAHKLELYTRQSIHPSNHLLPGDISTWSMKSSKAGMASAGRALPVR